MLDVHGLCAVVATTSAGNNTLPTHLDWRTKGNYITPVKNQAKCGSCWAHAAVAAIESNYAIKYGNTTLLTLSEQELLDCAGDDGGCDGGFSDAGFIYTTRNNGLSLENEYIYLEHREECKKDYYKHYNPITGYIEFEKYNEQALMTAVNNGPVVVGIEASYDFDYYNGGIFDGECGTDVNHMVLVVGYGEDEQTGNKYWIVKNSYGPYWGENGYIRICRDCHKNSVMVQCCIQCYPSGPLL